MTFSHPLQPGVTANQHHNQAHAIDGGDHSGTLAHSALGSITATDHHDHTGAWSTYTPTWTGSVSNPAIGNGSLAGRFKTLEKTVHFRISVVMGSTTTFGSGFWSFSLPPGVTASSSGEQVIPALGKDTSASLRYAGAGWVETSATTIARIIISDGVTGVSPTVPFTWAQDDQLHISGTIEIA